MAIYPPGQKFRSSKLLKRKKTKREVVAVLSLAAMVDMFTVLVIFLLQNFDPATNAVMFIPEKVDLPSAQQVKDLKPAVVVTISRDEILVDRKTVLTIQQARFQTDWLLGKLFQEVKTALMESKRQFDNDLSDQLKKAVSSNDTNKRPQLWSFVTIQSDKTVDFLTVKKVMYTITEAGATEINFAVNREAKKP